jgi:glycerophosphoryl diester phosphodiesterase
MAEDTSFVTIDADIKAVDQNKHDKVITRYSDPWGNYFTWKGIGAMPKAEKEQLEELIKKVHAKGKHIRFYHIPDKPNVWKFLLDEGVDWINTDKLAAYSKFYNNRIKNIPKLAGN